MDERQRQFSSGLRVISSIIPYPNKIDSFLRDKNTMKYLLMAYSINTGLVSKIFEALISTCYGNETFREGIYGAYEYVADMPDDEVILTKSKEEDFLGGGKSRGGQVSSPPQDRRFPKLSTEFMQETT